MKQTSNTLKYKNVIVSQEFYDRYYNNPSFPIDNMLKIFYDRMLKVENFCRDYEYRDLRNGLYVDAKEQIYLINRQAIAIDIAFHEPESPLHDAWQLIHLDSIPLKQTIN